MTETLLEGLGSLGQGLSYPGDMVRGLLAGKAGERVTGHQLLQQLGMDPGDDWTGMGAGIGVDIATDPLTYAGGALIKGLGGVLGKSRKARNTVGTPEWDRANVFDLPGDTAVADNLDLIDNAFPVPTAPAPATSPLAAAISPDVPLPMLKEVPSPASYEFGRTYRPGHMFTSPSPVDDMVAEGRTADALRANLGQWDHALDDLSRLAPGGGYATDLGRYGWADAVTGRVGDLDAMASVGSAVTDPAALALAADQAARIRNMFPALAGQQMRASHLDQPLGELVEGMIRPSAVPEMMAPGGPLAHLPLNEAELRRIAAVGQESAMQRRVGERVAGVEDYLNAPRGQGFGGVTMADVNLAGDAPDLGTAMYETDLVRQLINRIVGPRNAATYGDIEPNIARRVLAMLETTDPGLADRMTGLDAVAATYQPNLARAMAREAELKAAEAASRARSRGILAQPEF